MTPPAVLPRPVLDAFASDAIREGLVDAVFHPVDTPLGRLLLVQGPRGVVRIAFPEEPRDAVLGQVAGRLGPRIVDSAQETATARDALAAYLEGDDADPDVPVDMALVAGAFHRQVLEQLHAHVARGTVVTYGALAAAAGRPGAARAAGTACARNPVPLVVPCHRVVPGSGGVGSYGGGPERKRALLALEGALLPG